jgi:hypothetical protein
MKLAGTFERYTRLNAGDCRVEKISATNFY